MKLDLGLVLYAIYHFTLLAHFVAWQKYRVLMENKLCNLNWLLGLRVI